MLQKWSAKLRDRKLLDEPNKCEPMVNEISTSATKGDSRNPPEAEK